MRDAILAVPGAEVRLLVYEWSGPSSIRVTLDWTALTDDTVILAAARTLEDAPGWRMDPSTALGEALVEGAIALSRQPDCDRRTLDVSGDGRSNIGISPRDAGTLGGITVNGLVIGNGALGKAFLSSNLAELTAYFQADVIRGPDAFVETAIGYEDFADAMRRKLLREVGTMAVGQLAPR